MEWSVDEVEAALSRLNELSRDRSDPLSIRLQEILLPSFGEESDEVSADNAEQLKQAISLLWPVAFPLRETRIDQVTRMLADIVETPILDIQLVDGDRSMSFRGESVRALNSDAEEGMRDLLGCLPESDSLREEDSIDG